MRALRVLHLEDSARDAEMIRERIKAAGLSCTIILVNEKQRFESELASGLFDIILCDYNLPGYDGEVALKYAQTTQPDVPVILISGTAVEEQAVHCLQIGATDYLLKQRLERLVPAIERAINESDTRREKRRTETALAESEARKAAILDSVLDCIVTMDANGAVLDFNAAAVRTFGYSKADAIGRQLADLIVPPAFRDRHRQGFETYLATGRGMIGRVMELTALRSDGSEIPVELSITATGIGMESIFIGVLRDITARKHADAARARLAAIIDSSDDAIFSMDPAGTILTWNAGAERIYGYAAEDVIGQNWLILVPESHHSEFTPAMALARLGERGTPVETERVRQDGSIIDVSVMISPMTDPAGLVIGYSTIARDVTAQKLAEAAVRDERDRAEQYLNAADVILLGLDATGRISVVNRYACALLGWSHDDLIGKNFAATCLPARFRDGFKKRLEYQLAIDSSETISTVLSKSGEERWIEWCHSTMRDKGGKAIGTFSSGTDVTERKNSVDALRQAEERMRFALESTNVGIWDMDYATGVLRWSEAMESQSGFEPGAFDGTFDTFIRSIHPDDRAAMVDIMSTAGVSGDDFTTLYRSLAADGTIRWLSGAGRISLDEHGAPIRGVGISQDVTERRLLEEQYQQAQKMEAVGRLAAGVAHDFNNLLTVILGVCELLLADLLPADKRHADIVEIQNAGKRAEGLTRQLLAFSRKQIIAPTLLDLTSVVADVRVLLERLIGEDITVVFKTSEGLALVKADRGQVEQVILNLAVNARDAMPTGGTLTIETMNNCSVGRPSVPCVGLTIRDTGTGMAPEVRARLFEPFFTTKAVGKGTGLGLATVYGIVTRYKGTVTVESEFGRGSAFTVCLPQADSGERARVDAPVAVRTHAGGETILVVEDADGLRGLIRRILERHGYHVLVAANAAEALQLFDTNPSIDLLLTDVVMPGTSGPELVVQLKEQRPALKVVYMSGYTDDAIVHHGILDPDIAFLHKPFTAEALGKKIRGVLG